MKLVLNTYVLNIGLDRDKLVLVAMLTGSDYTDGVDGVGPVTALEILSEFLSDNALSFESLMKFRDWWNIAKAGNDTYKAENKLREKFRKLNLRAGRKHKSQTKRLYVLTSIL